MKFISKTEGYSYTLFLLRNRLHAIQTKDLGDGSLERTITQAVASVQRALENHEQDASLVARLLDPVILSLDSEGREIFLSVQKGLRESDYLQTAYEKLENPLARRAESELATLLLLNPTHAMMESVRRVSVEILKLIDDNLASMPDYFKNHMHSNAHEIALGAFLSVPTLEQVRTLLTENDPKLLPEIMSLHFNFARFVVREEGVKYAPVRMPVGKLLDIAKELYPGNPLDFFTKGIVRKTEGRWVRKYIPDTKISGSSLYMAPGMRGRCGYFNHRRTDQLGLMTWGQAEHEVGLPKHPSRWAADCKSQTANVNSQYVIDAIENDTVYVAGPSGMTSVLLGQMEILANFEHEDLKKNYLTAIVSYVVGGGFHSLHEVLGPAEWTLNLVPGYRVRPPQSGRLAPPPNYALFFEQQALIDAEFDLRRETAWQNYFAYFNTTYLPKYLAARIGTVDNGSMSQDKPRAFDSPQILDKPMARDELRMSEAETKTAPSLALESNAHLDEATDLLRDSPVVAGLERGLIADGATESTEAAASVRRNSCDEICVSRADASFFDIKSNTQEISPQKTLSMGVSDNSDLSATGFFSRARHTLWRWFVAFPANSEVILTSIHMALALEGQSLTPFIYNPQFFGAQIFFRENQESNKLKYGI